MWQEIISITISTVSDLGYLGIFVLMFLESSFIPFPSEAVMIPAGYLSYTGNMNLILVIISGIGGSVIGATFNYYLGYKIGRHLLIKYGKYILLNEKKIRRVESLFNQHGEVATFIGRLIPGVRQYISFPPGITKMKFLNFLIFTATGASIWVTILSLLGYYIGINQILVQQYLFQVTFILIVICASILVIYIIHYKRSQKIIPKTET